MVRTETFTIYGTAEALAARKLIAIGKAKEVDYIPPTHHTNKLGETARFAVTMDRHIVAEFEKLIEEYRL